MVFKVKSSMRIIFSAFLTEFYSFRKMVKPKKLCKKYIVFDSPPKRASWEGKSCCFVKKGSK